MTKENTGSYANVGYALYNAVHGFSKQLSFSLNINMFCYCIFYCLIDVLINCVPEIK